MLVAIPTAIPDEPLISRLGSLDGRTDGSFSEPSKLSTQTIVSLSRSSSISSAVFCSRHSVYLMAAAESPSTEPKLPCPSMRGYLNENVWAMRTMES